MADPHDRAARLAAKKLNGRYRPESSPDVKGKRGRAEVKTSAGEIPKALKQLGGGSGPAYVVLPAPEHKEAQRRLRGLKTGLMDYQTNIKKRSTRK
jgi:hypothetical protein